MSSLTSTPSTSAEPALKRSLKLHTKSAIYGRIAGVIVTVASSAVYARVFSREDFARFSVLQSFIMVLGIAASFGLGQTLLQLKGSVTETGEDQIRHKEPILRALGVASHLAVSIFSFVLFYFFGESILGHPVTELLSIAIAVSVLLRGLFMVYAELARVMDLPLIANTLSGPTGGAIPNGLAVLLTLVAATYFSQNLTSGTLISTFAVLLTGWSIIVLHQKWRTFTNVEPSGPQESHSLQSLPEKDPWTVRRLVLGSFTLTMTYLILAITEQIDIFIPTKFGDIDDASLYIGARRVMTLISIPLSVANMAVMSVIPTLYNTGQHSRLSQILQATTTITLIPCTALCALLAMFPSFVISVFLGEQYGDAYPYILALIPSQFAIVFSGSFMLVLLLSGNAKISLIVHGISAAILLGAGPFVVAHYGGLAYAILASALIVTHNIVGCLITVAVCGIKTYPSVRQAYATLSVLNRKISRRSQDA